MQGLEDLEVDDVSLDVRQVPRLQGTRTRMRVSAVSMPKLHPRLVVLGLLLLLLILLRISFSTHTCGWSYSASTPPASELPRDHLPLLLLPTLTPYSNSLL